jgi:hypothetical protein
MPALGRAREFSPPGTWDGARAAPRLPWRALRSWQHIAGDHPECAGAWAYLPLHELEGARIEPAVAPLESALVSAIHDARSRRRDIPALRPLVDYRTRAWPACLTADDPRGFAGELVEGIRRGLLHPDPWAPVLDAPDRWLRAVRAELTPRPLRAHAAHPVLAESGEVWRLVELFRGAA